MSEARGDDCLAVDEPIFYFDFSSPYAYLAATRIDDLLPRKPRWTPRNPPSGDQGEVEVGDRERDSRRRLRRSHVLVGEKLFWGDDRLGELAEILGG